MINYHEWCDDNDFDYTDESKEKFEEFLKTREVDFKKADLFLEELKELSEKHGIYITCRHDDSWYAPLLVNKDYFDTSYGKKYLYELVEEVYWNNGLNKYNSEDRTQYY